MMYMCRNCEAIFDAEQVESKLTFDGYNREQNEYKGYCPDCGYDSKQFVEMKSCPECQEDYPEYENHKCKEIVNEQ